MKDFLYYRSLVREDGLILLQDIKDSADDGRAWAGELPVGFESSHLDVHRRSIAQSGESPIHMNAITRQTI